MCEFIPILSPYLEQISIRSVRWMNQPFTWKGFAVKLFYRLKFLFVVLAMITVVWAAAWERKLSSKVESGLVLPPIHKPKYASQTTSLQLERPESVAVDGE